MRHALRKRNKKNSLLILVLLILLLIGYTYIKDPTIADRVTGKQPEPTAAVTVTATVPKVSAAPTAAVITPDGKIKVGAFNLQIFGTAKASKPEVMGVLSEIIRNFDVIAVQEIRDESQTALPALKDAVNSIGSPQYDYVVSDALGRTTSKEQYAYFYNTQTIRQIGDPYIYPDSTDMFQREPYIAEFKSRSGSFDFVAITIHTEPDNATQEINDLPKVVDNAKSRYPDEGDFIIMGDLNADCSYFNENSQSPLKGSDYNWVINNSVDTTTKSTNCTYDRIIITNPVKTCFTGDSGVFRFDTAYNLNYDSTIAVSDHYPVYAVFWNNRDTD